MLRGTLECGMFPLTGYPPIRRGVLAANLSDHQVLRAELHALSFLVPAGGRVRRRRHRRHDDSSRRAASPTSYDVGKNPAARRVSGAGIPADGATYGNHPSFCLMTLGNEYGGRRQAAFALDRHAEAGRPAAPLFLAFLRPNDRQSAIHRGARSRHSVARQPTATSASRSAKQDRPLWPRDRPMDVLSQLRGDEEIHRRAGRQEFRVGPRRPGKPRACSTCARDSSRPPASRRCCSTRKRSR